MTDRGLMVYSHLISSRDNALLFNLLGPECSAMASAVAQVLVASMEPGGHGATWRCEGTGVVCLVNDQSLKSYFLRLYSVKRAQLLWEQELYTPFRYSAPRPFFHTFPADEFQAGLNFADEEEAERFLSAVETQIKSTQHKGRKSFDGLHENTQDSPSCSAQMTLAHNLKPSSGQFFCLVDRASKNPEKSFDVNTLDPAQQKLFAKAEVSETNQKSKRVSRIHTMAERQGGLETVQKDSQVSQPQRLPKCRRAFSSLALKKGPLPPLPAQAGLPPGRELRSVTQNISNLDSRKGPFSATPLTHDAIPPSPSMPAPRIPPGHPSPTQWSASNR
ncbi:neural Wiskott-Aldrich syndrome protein [Anguilla anguilla]|uniref:neural Wiskott-Aldrich syndrome protein n=1 Tax=Anguilla anguilla TaxID=7936 RepID=UPI0015A8504C|nr:neural Wiskott-Aldrich syndrome protein [Anguilla anguilla]